MGTFVGLQMQADCRKYFEHHGRLISCFEDLRPTVERFDLKETAVFLAFISDYAKQHDGLENPSDDKVLHSPTNIFFQLYS